ncbi:polymer-forming cytoskeletal protein [Patescibacteria group bacterium]|nr:polymer-forming cytoskeletal protein [Patescibacteria group bacterium]
MFGKDLKIKPEDAETVIGAGVKVEGTFNAVGDVIVKGELTGSLETRSNLHLMESGVIEANIKSQNAIISGRVKGNLKVEEKIELGSTAQLNGDINCQSLSIEEGATLSGKCKVGGDLKAANKEKREEVEAEEE